MKISKYTKIYLNKKPCCRRERPHAAGCRHLYRKLAPNPRATQWIERTLKLSANMLSKNYFTSVPVKDWCMSPHGITRPLDQSSRNSIW